MFLHGLDILCAFRLHKGLPVMHEGLPVICKGLPFMCEGLPVMHHDCNHDSCAIADMQCAHDANMMMSCLHHANTKQTMMTWCSGNANTNDIMPHHSCLAQMECKGQ